jgi:hypothetical protein
VEERGSSGALGIGHEDASLLAGWYGGDVSFVPRGRY